jgi:hypothetical protein
VSKDARENLVFMSHRDDPDRPGRIPASGRAGWCRMSPTPPWHRASMLVFDHGETWLGCAPLPE